MALKHRGDHAGAQHRTVLCPSREQLHDHRFIAALQNRLEGCHLKLNGRGNVEHRQEKGHITPRFSRGPGQQLNGGKAPGRQFFPVASNLPCCSKHGSQAFTQAPVIRKHFKQSCRRAQLPWCINAARRRGGNFLQDYRQCLPGLLPQHAQ